jgi:hypothetical protein
MHIYNYYWVNKVVRNTRARPCSILGWKQLFLDRNTAFCRKIAHGFVISNIVQNYF